MKKKTCWLKEMSWVELVERLKTTDTIIIPGGAIEVYGPHLPLGSDILVSKAICELVADKTNTIIGPIIECGESSGLAMFPGTITLKQETYSAVLRDVLDSLIKIGFKNFMFIDMHAGNVPIVSYIAREYQKKYGIKCAQVDWWRFVQPNTVDICENTGWRAHGHASECGTSVLMELYPDLVDNTKFENVLLDEEKFNKYPDIITYYEFDKKTKSGILGDATIASKEKGEKIVEKCVDRIVEFMHKEFNC